MADGTYIEWTDATWNIITGCSVVSAGCKHCYAMKLAGTRLKHDPSRAGLTVDTKAGPVWNGQVRFNEKWLDQPLRWKRPRRIFVCAHGDLFHELVPDAWIDRVFAMMLTAHWHTFQVLTKRAERMRAYLANTDVRDRVVMQAGMLVGEASKRGDTGMAGMLWVHGKETITRAGGFWPLANVWLGVSVEDQAAAGDRIPYLLTTPAAVRWISAEPLLGPLDLGNVWPDGTATMNALTGDASHLFGMRERAASLDWVVAGGESGPGARPMHPAWARSLRDQCASAGVPFLFKQWGEFRPAATVNEASPRPTIAHNRFDGKDGAPSGCYHTHSQLESLLDGSGRYAHLDCAMFKAGKKAAGRLLDGVQHDGYPEAALR